jgi:hypothetical protein
MTASAQHKTRVFREVLIRDVCRAQGTRGAGFRSLRFDYVIGRHGPRREVDGRIT